MIYSDALRLLGLTGIPSADEVRAAFAKAAKEQHPDTGCELMHTMDTLKEARGCLLRVGHYQGHITNVCTLCSGTGYQIRGFHRVPCIKGCDPA